ncbi:MAG: adenylate/guanylate cyclase domain-containing protein [Candidatus Rokubacteria bacterium]|nr:adenylate/guanylate cyclase domain-containing protein [Candidatus Rokubacteria bacterium]
MRDSQRPRPQFLQEVRPPAGARRRTTAGCNAIHVSGVLHPQTSKSALEGERKQVTVLFVDVSGFTSLSERLDPEDVHRFMTRAFELMLAEVHRYEGTVNQFLGDGIMALFGAPIAHEDHVQRAVHAALRIRKALASYQEEIRRERGVSFQVRQGLNTGLVVVGSIGNDLRMDYTAVGFHYLRQKLGAALAIFERIGARRDAEKTRAESAKFGYSA